jgi:hypothetical protein
MKQEKLSQGELEQLLNKEDPGNVSGQTLAEIELDSIKLSQMFTEMVSKKSGK